MWYERPYSPEVSSDNELFVARPSTNVIAFVLDKETEEFQGEGYVGQRVTRKRPLLAVASSEDEDCEESEAESFQPSPSKRVLRKRRAIQVESSDGDEQSALPSSTLPSNEPDLSTLVDSKPSATTASSNTGSFRSYRSPSSYKRPKFHHATPESRSRAFPTKVELNAPEPTVVTSRVYEICQELYPDNEFLVVGSSQQERVQLTAQQRRNYPIHEDDPDKIEWLRETRTIPNHYRSVLIDGVRFDVGDSVMLEPPEEWKQKHATKASSSNPHATSKWFAKICYMYQDVSSTDKWAHVQYYEHGASIILRETAHPYQLFLIDDCENIDLESIYQKINIYQLDSTEDEPSVTKKDNVYLTGLYWDGHNTKFFRRNLEEEDRARRRCKRGRQCVSCGMNKIQDDLEEWQHRDGAYVQQDVTYHVNDFVYIRPELHETDVYVIAQIVEIHPSEDVEKKYHSVDLRVYQRCDLILRNETKHEFGEQEMDERRLFRSDTFLDDYDVRYIEGKAFVVHRNAVTPEELDDWAAHEDHFYVDCKAESEKPRSTDEFEKLSQRSFRACTECIEARQEYVKEQKRLMETHKPLQGLELFAGAGGLSTGFDESGFVETRWAVELGESASLTYATNHPDAKVYNHSVNKVLHHAIETFEGSRPKPLYSKLGKRLPLMPKPGEVDFIYGGPPCQGFSRMNHTKTVDDYRNTLVCNMLSYVDFYRPKYFMLENVEGILYHPLAATQERPGSTMEGGVRMGVVKLILRVLISLGYHAHFKLLQAGQYGAPQSRLRTIFLGAKRDLPLPAFPIPTHCTADDVQHVTLETGNLLRPVVRVIPSVTGDIKARRSWLQFAPLLRVSVEDAISDLPRFDWIDPCQIITEPQSLPEIAQRLQQGIRRFDAVNDKAANKTLYSGYMEPEPYISGPLSRYQKWMRRSVRDDEGVTYQYTQRYRANVVECVVNVPLKPEANHTDLPEPLRNPVWFEDGKIHGKSKNAYTSVYGRVNGKWHFQTALTSANPNAKGGRLLHPTQKRVLSIREFARAQGFPDHQQFLSLDDNAFPDQIRQIGNAVPVPLASALGRSIGKVLTSRWIEEDARELSPEIPMNLG
ncbi:hypothetical protein PHLGIDRAFT_116344 [Phlebiopsis gigantea 11061_1 CR5-6]|uniref:Cytosine-specific methyltransferase n=1 Tax=Phlebiopsis gigantea (strain 11061_1 CR5-6) TaxID=745531 RepID=A0A0C3SAW3_PHLG1|nr:hypothetical protein PHLGIDRAFT_116344 [Phlebiopsis gigantea 11061_1 CR5-6]